MSDNREDYLLIQSLRVNALYNNAAIPVVVMLCGAFGLTITFWDERNTFAQLFWFISLISITAVRCFIVWKYHQSDKEPEKYPFWLNLYFIGTCFSGAIWGSTAFLLPTENSVIELGLITMFMLVVVAGSIGIYTVFKRIYFALSLFSIVPLIIFLLIQDDEQLNQLCLITSIFTFFIFIVHFHANNILNQLLLIQFDNNILLKNYEKDQDKINILERLNRTRTEQLEKARLELSYLKKSRE